MFAPGQSLGYLWGYRSPMRLRALVEARLATAAAATVGLWAP